MSDLDPAPTETMCAAPSCTGPVIEFYPVREVPLGGVRGVNVARALPQRELPTVGAWCFLDHFGSPSIGRPELPPNIDPHPHIGLQTVTWPFEGQIRHRDSVGSDVQIRPGQLNLMTAGRGIAHSEYAVADSPAGSGLQLWIALPQSHTGISPHFEQHQDLPVYDASGVHATVFMGSLAGLTSPATAYSPLVGVDVHIEPGTDTTLPLTPTFEHAILVIEGDVTASGVDISPGRLLYLGTDRDELSLASQAGARFVLLGGEPLGEDIVMWWNFVAHSHDEIVQARSDWEQRNLDRFPDIAGHPIEERVPAPPMPNLRLKPRRHR